MNWNSKEENNLPDFIIGGAMKSGTTSLHQILEQHPDVFIPERELHFFDIDNIIQHPDFNFYNPASQTWQYQSMSQQSDKLWDWYHSFYRSSKELVKGEVSSTYLASPMVPERISKQKKPIKFVFSLRHPTSRAYSNYWHLVKTGRTSHTFEELLRINPDHVLSRSLYKEQLEPYYKKLGQARIKTICFEGFIANPTQTIQELCHFLNIVFDKIPANSLSIHAHQSRVSSNIKLQLLRNKLLSKSATLQYINSLPISPKKISISFSSKVINKLHDIINPANRTELPKMHSSTKSFLDEYFYDRLNGINELIGFDILEEWFPQRS
jgi:hypothetical protein